MLDKSLLGCLVVIRCYEKECISSGLLCFYAEVDSCLGAVGSGSCDDGNSSCYLLYGMLYDIYMLLMCKC